MAWKILCMDCDLSRTIKEDEKKLTKCPECNSENIQIYEDETSKGAHCAGTINPSALK